MESWSPGCQPSPVQPPGAGLGTRSRSPGDAAGSRPRRPAPGCSGVGREGPARCCGRPREGARAALRRAAPALPAPSVSSAVDPRSRPHLGQPQPPSLVPWFLKPKPMTHLVFQTVPASPSPKLSWLISAMHKHDCVGTCTYVPSDARACGTICRLHAYVCMHAASHVCACTPLTWKGL